MGARASSPAVAGRLGRRPRSVTGRDARSLRTRRPRSLELDALQRLLRGCGGGRVRVALDAFVEGLLRELEVAAFFEGDAGLVGGVGGFVLVAVVVGHAAEVLDR